jgi:hypothetical protein
MDPFEARAWIIYGPRIKRLERAWAIGAGCGREDRYVGGGEEGGATGAGAASISRRMLEAIRSTRAG